MMNTRETHEVGNYSQSKLISHDEIVNKYNICYKIAMFLGSLISGLLDLGRTAKQCNDYIFRSLMLVRLCEICRR